MPGCTGAATIKLRRRRPKSFSMRRSLMLLALSGALTTAPAPALAQSGGAEVPAPGAPGPGAESGGAGYYPNAKDPSKLPEKRRTKRPPASKPHQRASRHQRHGGAPVQNPPPLPPVTKGHRFPLVGPFGFGGEDARFGARRRGHAHQGQDLTAAAGAPVVAPRTGLVEAVRYQAAGAGHYVVLDGEGEDRDYVFMHLRSGSILVAAGQRVPIGAPLGQVGNTGVSSGPHLHFEIWAGGGWYTGGHPIDPLPLLRMWAAR